MLRPWFPQGIIRHFSESVERVVVQDEQQQRDQWYQWKCGWTWRRKYLGWLDAKQVKKSSKYQFVLQFHGIFINDIYILIDLCLFLCPGFFSENSQQILMKLYSEALRVRIHTTVKPEFWIYCHKDFYDQNEYFISAFQVSLYLGQKECLCFKKRVSLSETKSDCLKKISPTQLQGADSFMARKSKGRT